MFLTLDEQEVVEEAEVLADTQAGEAERVTPDVRLSDQSIPIHEE